MRRRWVILRVDFIFFKKWGRVMGQRHRVDTRPMGVNAGFERLALFIYIYRAHSKRGNWDADAKEMRKRCCTSAESQFTGYQVEQETPVRVREAHQENQNRCGRIRRDSGKRKRP